MFKLLVQEIHNFIKNNYYILIIAIIAFIPLVFMDGNTSLIEIASIFGLHLLADIFMAMMMFELGQGNKKTGYIYQFIGSMLFFIIGFISGILHNNWIYLIPNLIYLPVTLNNLSIAYKSKDYKLFNFTNLFIFAIILYIIMIGTGLSSGLAQSIQLFGVLGFAVCLRLTSYKNVRRYGIVILLIMISGGLIKMGNEFYIDNLVNGATFSYSILPLVVLISFIKNK